MSFDDLSNPDFSILIARRIRAARKRLNLRPLDVVARSGLPQTTYYRFETEGGNFRLYSLRSLVRGLGISLSELLISPAGGLQVLASRDLPGQTAVLAELVSELLAAAQSHEALRPGLADELAVALDLLLRTTTAAAAERPPLTTDTD